MLMFYRISIKRVEERDKMGGLPTIFPGLFYLFFAMSLINSMIQEHEC